MIYMWWQAWYRDSWNFGKWAPHEKYVLCAWIIGDIDFSTMNGLSDWEIETAALRVREVDIFTQLFNVFLLFYL